MTTLRGPYEWEQLVSLCAGYLHQDFVVEHGSAAAAVDAWLAEADAEATASLAGEWRRFLNLTGGESVAQRARALRELAGGAWAPADEAEFAAVSDKLLGPWRR